MLWKSALEIFFFIFVFLSYLVLKHSSSSDRVKLAEVRFKHIKNTEWLMAILSYSSRISSHSHKQNASHWKPIPQLDSFYRSCYKAKQSVFFYLDEHQLENTEPDFNTGHCFSPFIFLKLNWCSWSTDGRLTNFDEGFQFN